MLEDKLTSQELLEMNSCIPLVINIDYLIRNKEEEKLGRTKNYRPIEFYCEPQDSAKLKKEIIEKFCKQNEISIPHNLHKKNAAQIHGLFTGMEITYGKMYKTPYDLYV